MSQQPNRPARPKSEKTEISVAKITLIGTVITAVCGMLGIALTVFTPLVSQMWASLQNGPNQSRITGSILPSATAGEQRLAFSAERGCVPLVLPASIQPEVDSIRAADLIGQAVERREIDYWAVGPGAGEDNQFFLKVEVSSKVNGQDWLRLEQPLNLSVIPQELEAGHTDIIADLVWGCGGAGEYREFDQVVGFRSDLDSYRLKMVYAGADYFSLEPGEFEVMTFRFTCQSPGAYRLALETPYTYQSQSGSQTWDVSVRYTCPESFSLWSVAEWKDLTTGLPSALVKTGEYTWDGEAYR